MSETKSGVNVRGVSLYPEDWAIIEHSANVSNRSISGMLRLIVREWSQKGRITRGGECPACHTRVVFAFVGMQEDGEGGYIDLWNCPDCHSTVSGRHILD